MNKATFPGREKINPPANEKCERRLRKITLEEEGA